MDILDSLLQDMEIMRPALLRIDIEGGEFDCLLGGEKTMTKIDYIVVELPLVNKYKMGYRFSEVISFLAERNFEVFQVLKAGNNNIEMLFSRVDDSIRDTWVYPEDTGARHNA